MTDNNNNKKKYYTNVGIDLVTLDLVTRFNNRINSLDRNYCTPSK